jgi:hypothetical protein
MTARNLALTLALLMAPPLWAAEHHGGGGGAPSGHSFSSGHSSAPRAGSHAPAGSALGLAESRHPRAGTGTGGFFGYGRGFGRGFGYPYYRPFYNPFFFGSFYWGWPYAYDPFYYGGYYGGYGYGAPGYGAPGYYDGYRYGDRASVRVIVKPDKTRVFVDGYYAGVADDFDGLFHRLHVSPGRHELALKLEGYRTHRMRIYVGPGATLKVQYDMVQGTGEDPIEDLAGGAGGADRERYDDRDRDRDRDLSVDPDRGRPDVRGVGRVRLDVQPPDASIYVDGQFRGTARQIGELELPPGRHRVEIVRPGFRTDDREVDVDSGRTRDLTVELQRP